jgi:hypothetical protein
MTEPRKCVTCLLPERRWKDEKGREQVNLSPITTQCVDCLIAYTKETNETMRSQPELTFDARAADARNDS